MPLPCQAARSVSPGKYAQLEAKDLLISNYEHELMNVRNKTKELELYAKDNVLEIDA